MPWFWTTTSTCLRGFDARGAQGRDPGPARALGGRFGDVMLPHQQRIETELATGSHHLHLLLGLSPPQL